MRSMTDFIDTVSNSERLAVYNEDYSWAEEYADYFNEESVNYTQPILESSEYQFFGETCFIQEASKGLLAGGMLALLSGAFFMIMKLLNGGGGGGGSSSGSTSSSSSSNKTNNRSNNNNNRPPSGGGGGNHNNKPPTNPPSGGSAGQPQAQPIQSEKLKAAEAELQRVIEEKHKAEEETKRTLQRMDQMQKENDAKLKAQNDAFNAKIKAEQEAKAKAAKEKAAAKADEDEKHRKALLEESKRKAEKAKKAKDEAYVQPAELEAEENLVFNAKIIIDELNKFKKQGYDEIDVRNGQELYTILQGLEKIDEITDFLVKLVKDGHWDIFGSSVTEKGYAGTFHKKCAELHEIVEKIKSESSRINDENGSSHDISIDSVISDINNIDKVTKDIESKCKEGMKLCKAERTKLINAKKDVSNVDKAYKILNGIIRDVNVVCKNIQTAFRTVHKAFMGKKHPYPLNPSWIPLSHIGTSWDPFVNSRDYMSFIKTKSYGDVKPEEIADKALKGLRLCCENVFYANDYTKISDKTLDAIKNWGTDNQKTIQTSLNNISKIFNACRKEKPGYSGIFDKVEQVAQKGYELLLDMYKVNPASETLVGKKKSECKEPAFVNLLTYAREYLFDDRPKYEDLLTRISNSSGGQNKNTPVTEFFKLIGDNGKRLEGALPNFELSKFKEIYQKADSNFNYDKSDEEEYMNKVVGAIEKYVYGSDSKVGDEEWKKIESFLEIIGFKSAGLSAGDKLTTTNRTLFARPISASTNDSSKDMTIKQIQQQPRILKIEVDGKMETYKLAGKCTYWKVGMGSVGGKDTEDPNKAKVSDKAYAEKSKIPRYRDLNVGWTDLTAEEQRERERYYSRYNSTPTQTNTQKQREMELA